jgi:predicted RNA binding protein YcfA (HicA-like mRNA interferase family)
VPKKIRELKQMLRRAGFSERQGKGSHTNWAHPLYPGRITVSGNDGDDAKPYQEKTVEKAIKLISGGSDG